ncbi:MAG TPA: cation:proton antiporter family protein [Patescibacteria group bacterium]|nr:cation:proton antiporter family protein [Patescibacteria group bacterium]
MDFYNIALGLVVAAAFGYLAKVLKQPLLVGYLFAGIFIGLTRFLGNSHSFDELGKIGITLLLFLLGLEMNLKELPTIGKAAFMTAIGQIILTTSLGMILAIILGYSVIGSLYIGIALSFSSTIIIVKLLSDKSDLGSLHGRLSVGLLLVQDFVAIGVLIVLTAIGDGASGFYPILVILLKMVFLIVSVYFLSKKLIVIIFEKYFSQPVELLFVVSIAWALGIAAFVGGPFGLTIEIGGFLAGLALSNLPEHLQIVSKAKPLRDFFVILFFLFLGTQFVSASQIWAIIPKALIFSIFVLIADPIAVLLLLGLFGYKKKTSFLTGITVAQISEFSFIIMAAGVTLGIVTSSDATMMYLVGIFTMTLSTYLIMNSEKLYLKLKKYLNVFEKEHSLEISSKSTVSGLKNHIVLIGCDRTGTSIHKYLDRKSIQHLIADINPSVISRLSGEKANIIFGDVEDLDILSEMRLPQAKMMISTVNVLDTNLVVLNYLKTEGIKIIKIVKALNKHDALQLYDAGADYVIVPEIAAGDHLKHLLMHYDYNSAKYAKLGKLNYAGMIK